MAWPKIDPRSALAQGADTDRFERRLLLAIYILNIPRKDLQARYGMRREFEEHIDQGAWPRPMDRREFMELFRLTPEEFYGAEDAPFVRALREVRRWELSSGIVTQTPSSWADFFATRRTKAFPPVVGVGHEYGLTTRVPKTNASTSMSPSSPSETASSPRSSSSPKRGRS